MLPRSLSGKVVLGLVGFMLLWPLAKATTVDHDTLRVEMQRNRQSTQAAVGEGVELGKGIKDELLGQGDGVLTEQATVSAN
jgi:hypothetical protein